MVMFLIYLVLPLVSSCKSVILDALDQLAFIGQRIEQHFPVDLSSKSGLSLASKTIQDTHSILLSLAQVAIESPFCFSAETRLDIIRTVPELSTLSTSVFRSYFHALELGKVWYYSLDERNELKVMEIVSKLHINVADIHQSLLDNIEHLNSVDKVAPFVFQDHTATGTFLPTEILLRIAFPEIPEALTDKGLLRALIRKVFPVDATIADLGALDGQYSRWLNDTGLVEAFAFDGIQDVEALTNGRVQFFDLTSAEGGPEGPFDFVLCLEVAEHIPKDQEHVFLTHLRRLSRRLIISWSASEQGVAHVNLKTETEVELTMASIGYVKNPVITAMLRKASTIAWIKDTVSFFERS